CVTAWLRHGGVVPVYALLTDLSGRPAYAMRFVQGQTLAAHLEAFHSNIGLARDLAQRSSGLRKLLGHFIAVCRTVAHAHRLHILHRDLKPHNLMVEASGETLVMDWGLAKLLPGAGTLPSFPSEPAEENLPALSPTETPPERGFTTQDAVRMGTLAYMPPEAEDSPAGDIYSLGATLYHLLTGQPLPYRTLPEVVRGDFPPPRQH